jgi:hypothetical protein
MRSDPDTRAAGRAAAKQFLLPLLVLFVVFVISAIYSFSTMPPGGFG